jgi:hypothetical protein
MDPMPEQLVVGFNPMSAANKVAYCGSQIRQRLVWMVVAVMVCFVIWRWQGQAMTSLQVGMLFGLGLVYALIWLAIAFVRWLIARSGLSSVSSQVALAVNRQGLWLQGVGLSWSQIAQVAVTPGWFGGSPKLTVRRVDGEPMKMSLASLDAMPGTIDSAIRAYSGGAQRIDTSKLGN